MTNIVRQKNFNMGGLADSKWLGPENSFARAMGFDLHSAPGVLKVNQALTQMEGKTTADEIDDFIKAIVVSSDGTSYLFGSTNGKVWQKTNNEVEHIGTVDNGVLSAIEWYGYIYYTQENQLGRIAIGDTDNWDASSTDNWETFNIGDPDYHPIVELNELAFYIGDGYNVASVDTEHNFSDSALWRGIQPFYRISALGKMGTSLLIGTYVNDNVHETRIMRWDTWSLKLTSYDPIPEVGVHAFLETDNIVFAICGYKGNIYFYNGQELEDFKKIPGEYERADRVKVHNSAVANWEGLPVFGLSRLSGRPGDIGVYSLGAHSRNYPKVLNLENFLSFGPGDDDRPIEIGAIAVDDNGLIVTWRRNAHLALPAEHGVDITDNEKKQPYPFLETRIMNMGREELHNLIRHVAAYVEMPEGTDINIYKSVNYEPYELMTSVHDTIRKHKVATLSESIGVIQLKIECVTNNNSAPIIEEIITEPNA